MRFIPALQKKYLLIDNEMVFGGFSLGGLAAVYSLFLTDIFSQVFSVCGSFWYPNFSEFAENENLLHKNVRLFLLNGKAEGSNHQNILENAPEKAQHIHQHMLSQIKDCTSIWDEYGHHEAMAERVQQVKNWLKSKQ